MTIAKNLKRTVVTACLTAFCALGVAGQAEARGHHHHKESKGRQAAQVIHAVGDVIRAVTGQPDVVMTPGVVAPVVAPVVTPVVTPTVVTPVVTPGVVVGPVYGGNRVIEVGGPRYGGNRVIHTGAPSGTGMVTIRGNDGRGMVTIRGNDGRGMVTIRSGHGR